MRRTTRLMLIAALATFWFASAPCAQACPNCRDSVPTDVANAPPPGSLAEGFAWSIYLMMAAPFVLVSGLGGMLYITLKRADHVTQPEGAPSSSA